MARAHRRASSAASAPSASSNSGRLPPRAKRSEPSRRLRAVSGTVSSDGLVEGQISVPATATRSPSSSRSTPHQSAKRGTATPATRLSVLR